MSGVQFEAWPKTPRLNRDVIFTEKIDGTNAAIVIVPLEEMNHIRHESGAVQLIQPDERNLTALVTLQRPGVDHEETFAVFSQSRNRFVTPGKATDNYGFAGWVRQWVSDLIITLGPGAHYGEWWGAGIQRGYGLPGGDKRFSLFNALRWADLQTNVPGLGVVPVLPFNRIEEADAAAAHLRLHGSLAAPDFDRPEGIIAFHTAARSYFKVLLEGDDFPKGLAA